MVCGPHGSARTEMSDRHCGEPDPPSLARRATAGLTPPKRGARRRKGDETTVTPWIASLAMTIVIYSARANSPNNLRAATR
jgi:hypothetical protein